MRVDVDKTKVMAPTNTPTFGITICSYTYDGFYNTSRDKNAYRKVAPQPDFVPLNKIGIQYQLIDRIPKLVF